MTFISTEILTKKWRNARKKAGYTVVKFLWWLIEYFISDKPSYASFSTCRCISIEARNLATMSWNELAGFITNFGLERAYPQTKYTQKNWTSVTIKEFMKTSERCSASNSKFKISLFK